MIDVKTITAYHDKIDQEDRVISEVEFVHAGIEVRLLLKIWVNPESSKIS
jgi:hypothetical protein